MDDTFKLVVLGASNIGSAKVRDDVLLNFVFNLLDYVQRQVSGQNVDIRKILIVDDENIIDPYLKVKLGESFFKQTKPVRRTCHPKFNEIFDIPFDRKETHCIVEVWDYDMLGQDKMLAHVKIPILDEGDGVTRNAQFEELKDKEIMSFLTYKYSIHRSTKPDDYGAVMSTFDDYPYFGTFRIYETWEISLKDSVLYFYSPSHLYNEKLNRDYFTVECVLGIVTIQEFIFNLKFQSQFEDAKPGTSIDKRKKRNFYTLLDPGSDTPHLIRKHLPALDFVCSYLDEASGIMITQYTTVIDMGSSGAFVVSYYSNCVSRNREVYEKFMEQSSFVKTENLPWTDIELFDGVELKIPFGFKVGSESGIVFLFSPIQQCYQDVICDNFMIQLLVTDSSLVKVATSIQNQFREKKQLELVEDLELIDLELGSTLIYGYRFEVKFVEEIKGSVNTRNVSQLVVVFNGVDAGQKFVFTYTSTTGLPCRSLFLQMIETFSS